MCPHGISEKAKSYMANTKSVIIKIKRQLTPDAKPSWEEFEIAYKPNMNVTSALMEIAANPVTRDGRHPAESPTTQVRAASSPRRCCW